MLLKESAHVRERSVSDSKVPPASCFWREAEVRFGALKTKSCLSIENASSFCLAEKRARVAKNVQPALFLLFRFLLCVQKKMKKRSRICGVTRPYL